MRPVASIFKKVTELIKMEDAVNQVNNRFKTQKYLKRQETMVFYRNICQILHLDLKKANYKMNKKTRESMALQQHA